MSGTCMMDFKKPYNQWDINEAQWDIVDVLLVFFILIASCAGFLIILFIYIKDRRFQFLLFGYGFPILSFCVPLFWLKIKYNIALESLGLKRGKYCLKINIFISALAAIVIFGLITSISPSINNAEIAKKAFSINSIIAILLVPFTSVGIAKFVFTPIGEEILLRGFLYGYLRKKLNLIFAIIAQGIFSTLMHIAYLKEAYFSHHFIIEASCMMIIFSVLACIYEATKSLYPSILCHGMYNFLVVISPILFRLN